MSEPLRCPRCGCHDTVCLTHASERSGVDWHQCSQCGRLWDVPRSVGEKPCDDQPQARER
jgi:hypothetical protein